MSAKRTAVYWDSKNKYFVVNGEPVDFDRGIREALKRKSLKIMSKSGKFYYQSFKNPKKLPKPIKEYLLGERTKILELKRIRRKYIPIHEAVMRVFKDGKEIELKGIYTRAYILVQKGSVISSEVFDLVNDMLLNILVAKRILRKKLKEIEGFRVYFYVDYDGFSVIESTHIIPKDWSENRIKRVLMNYVKAIIENALYMGGSRHNIVVYDEKLSYYIYNVVKVKA